MTRRPPPSQPLPPRPPMPAIRPARRDEDRSMKDATLLKTGIAGSLIAVICCATPLLVVLLGAIGLSAWLGWIDYVLMPALAFRSEEHTSELQSLMRISYAVFCLKK